MKLTLRLANQDSDTGQVRTLETGRLSIGRGAENDWVLADPDRTLSKNHCRIDASEAGFLLTDLSTNGVFLAGAPQPVGRGHSVALEDGDVVALGPYRLHAEISAQDAPALAMPAGLGLPEAAPSVSPLTPAIPEPWLADVPGAGFGPGRRAAPQGWDAPPDPATYAATGLFEQHAAPGRIPSDAFADSPGAFSGQAEHVAAGATSMRLPQAQVVLPSDWMEGDDPLAPEPPAAQSLPAAPAVPAPWPPALPEEPPAPVSEASVLPADWVLPEPEMPAEPAPVITLPASWAASPEAATAPPTEAVPASPSPAQAPAVAALPGTVSGPQAAAAPVTAQVIAPPPVLSPFPLQPAAPADPLPGTTRTAPQPPAQLPAAPSPATRAQAPLREVPATRPQPVTPVAAPPGDVPEAPVAAPQAADEGGHASLVAAFLDGAGLPPDTLAAMQAEAAFREIGQMVRAAVEGVREIMSTRALVKSEFRVDQTVLRRSDNNPVKFAPDTQRCLAAMVGAAPPGFLPGAAAMQQSMDDIKLHELSLVAALNSVFADLGTQLDPETISRRARQEAGLADKLPYARDAKCWAVYLDTYAKLQESGAANTGGSLLAPLAEAYARQLRRGR